MNNELKNILEAVFLVADSPLSIAKLQGLFEEGAQPETEEIRKAIESLQIDCEDRGIELRKIGNGYRYQTKVKYSDWIRKLYATRPPKMSRALLETLAIIAYRQPVTRGDIEEIRGVSVSSDIIQKLQERQWVKQVGVRDVPGRPGIFGTTPEFLSYFNLESLKELPSLMEERELMDIAKELETPLPAEVLLALGNKNQAENEEESAESQSSLVADSDQSGEHIVTQDDTILDPSEMTEISEDPNGDQIRTDVEYEDVSPDRSPQGAPESDSASTPSPPDSDVVESLDEHPDNEIKS